MSATKGEQNAFINLIAQPVIDSCKSHGWGCPSAIIAQACLESAWGKSGLWKKCYNGWGMKWVEGCGTDYRGYETKEQRSDGTYYTIIARFRKYPTIAKGIDGYFDFIESYKRYAPVRAIKHTDYKGYATQIKACGWATSLKYAQNIIATVEAHGLTKYDTTDTVSTSDLTDVAKKVIAGEYGNGEMRKSRLRAEGYDYEEVQKKVNELLKG